MRNGWAKSSIYNDKAYFTSILGRVVKCLNDQKQCVVKSKIVYDD